MIVSPYLCNALVPNRLFLSFSGVKQISQRATTKTSPAWLDAGRWGLRVRQPSSFESHGKRRQWGQPKWHCHACINCNSKAREINSGWLGQSQTWHSSIISHQLVILRMLFVYTFIVLFLDKGLYLVVLFVWVAELNHALQKEETDAWDC